MIYYQHFLTRTTGINCVNYYKCKRIAVVVPSSCNREKKETSFMSISMKFKNERTNKQRDRQIDRQTDRLTDRQTVSQKENRNNRTKFSSDLFQRVVNSSPFKIGRQLKHKRILFLGIWPSGILVMSLDITQQCTEVK